MGKSSGAVRGLPSGGYLYEEVVGGVEDLVKIKDPAVYRDMKEAISRYHAVLGVRQKSVKLADLEEGKLGVHATDVKTGKSVGIYINKAYFNQSRAAIIRSQRKGYDSGWATRTNKPIAHTVTHELGHATWNSSMKGARYVAAGKEIYKLSGQWLRDRRKSGYGKYAHTNLDEFWAETVTRAVHGTQDKYTRAVKRIIKKYGL